MQPRRADQPALRLLAADGVALEGPLDGDKGSTWVVTTARYLAPLQLKDLAGHY